MSASAKKIGKYLLYELLARGGMAEVYRGKSVGASGFEKRVAIKRILADFAASDEFQRMFLSEAKINATLLHSNIVQVLDFFREGEELILVMDFIFGRNMRQVLKRIQEKNISIPIPVALYIIIKVAEALDYSHRKIDEASGKALGIIHRDVSPQNVMVTFEGDVKIVDFGIAKLASSAEKTQTGVLKGKFGYMSPEQIEGLTLDYRSDIFSLGVVLYEVLAGQKLFQADTEVQVIKLIQTFRPPRMAAKRPEVSESLEAVLHKALSKDRVQRFQSALDFGQALQKILLQEYGGCSAPACAQFIQELFQTEYQNELQLMRVPTDVALIDMAHSEARSVAARATGTSGASTHIKLPQAEATVRKLYADREAQYHELTLDPGVRFKIELDRDISWEAGMSGVQKNMPQSAGPSSAAVDQASVSETPAKRQSLLLRWWKDPKKRKWLIISAVVMLLLFWLLQSAPPPETPTEIQPQAVTQPPKVSPVAPEKSQSESESDSH